MVAEGEDFGIKQCAWSLESLSSSSSSSYFRFSASQIRAASSARSYSLQLVDILDALSLFLTKPECYRA